MPASHSRRGRPRAFNGRARFLPVYDDKGVWVTVAGILIVGVVMISMATWVARELPAARSEEEFRRTEDLLDALVRLQGNLQVIEPDDVVTFQAAISSSASSMYAPKLTGTLSTIDASESAIRVIAHTTRWDFEEGMWRSENGLSENIYVGSDADGYGYITLDGNWYGNRFITKTTRTLGIAMNSCDSVFSARFVAPGDVIVDSASLLIYNTGNPDANDNYTFSIYITDDDNHGRPNITPNSTTRNPVSGSIVWTSLQTVSDNYPVAKGTWGWVPATGLSASLTSGKVYHLVLDVAGNPDGVGPNDWDHLVIAYTEPRNTVWVDNGVGNENRSVVAWCRGTIDENPHWNDFYWMEPVFVLGLVGGNYWGNPYHGGFKYYNEGVYYPDIESYGDNKTYISYSYMDNCYSAGVINSFSGPENDNVWGENFLISQSTTISAIEVPVDRHGLPTSDLYVYIENSTWSEGHILRAEDIRTGDTPQPDSQLLTPVRLEGVASGNPAWYRVTLDQPVTLAADNYSIYLRTRGDTRDSYYRVPLDNADNAPANVALGGGSSWGGVNSRAFRASVPNENENLLGISLQHFENVDMPFRLIFENYKENAMYTSPVIAPGKRVKWLNLTWDNDTPVGTEITVQVRVGDMTHPENPNLPDDPNYPWSEWKTIQKGQDLGDENVFGDNCIANALQYRIMLSTIDPTVAPVVRAVYVRYFEGVGTTRAQLPVEWIQTTDDDFESWRASGTENVHIGGGAVTLGIPVYDNGVFISTFDAGEAVDWKSIEFDNVTPANTTFSLKVRFSDDNSSWPDWGNVENVTSGQSLADNFARYVQYRATFTTTDSNCSPTLKRVSISYIPIDTESLSQTDWSGGSTSPTLESGTWPSDYDRYYDGYNVDATLSVGDVSLDYGGDNRSWGNQFIVNTTLASATLDNSNEYLSLRFRARRTENVHGARVYVENYSFAGLAVQICRDDPSNPGKPGDNLTPEKEVQISSTGWLYIQLSAPAQLVKDNIYHIVLRMVPVLEITSSWTQTDWAGGPKSPVDVGAFSGGYNNFFENDNVDWSTDGAIKLATTSELSITPGTNNLIIDGTENQLYGEKHYNIVEIKNNGKLVVPRYQSGTDNGRLVLQANQIIVQPGSSIVADNAGYPGGAGGTSASPAGENGTSYDGKPGTGGGQGAGDGSVYTSAPGGGGGGYGGAGGKGGTASAGPSPGAGGSPYGFIDITYEDIGSGGGGGGFCYDGGENRNGTAGGAGGGAIRLVADNILIEGTVSANGENGGIGMGTYQYSSTGGGGSGGSIVLCGRIITVTGTLRANGGNGGNTLGAVYSGTGGGGGGGRIKIGYSETLNYTATISTSYGVRGTKYSGASNDGENGDFGTFYHGPPRGYVENGWFTSSVYDSSSNNTQWGVIEWSGLKPSGTDNVVKVRLDNSLSDLLSPSKPWSQVDNGDNLNENGRYAQYRVEFTSNENFSPEIHDITLHYTTRPGEYGSFAQTSWQGGDNQAMWSVENMFYASENIDWENVAGDGLELLTEGTENYGNPFRVGDNAIIGTLNNDSYLADIRFTAQSTRSITGVRFYVRNAYYPRQFKVRLCNNGPSNAPVLSPPLRENDNVLISSPGWVLANLGPVTLYQDNVYHIVINRVIPSAENNFVGAEPDPLVDGTTRVGTAVDGTTYSNTLIQDGIYENICENLVMVKATVAYSTSSPTPQQPKVRTFDGLTWSPESAWDSAGADTNWIRSAYCPSTVRPSEKIVVALTATKSLMAYVWNGASWRLDNIGRVEADIGTRRPFDVAYENSSGRALVVYGVESTDGTQDLAYRIWDGSNWSSPSYLDDPDHAGNIVYYWVALASQPNSDNMALIGSDNTNGDATAWIWHGRTSNWDNFAALENNLPTTGGEAIAVAWETATGHAVFAWGWGAGAGGSVRAKGKEWTGSWGDNKNTPTVSSLSGAICYYLSLKSNPNPASDNLMLTITLSSPTSPGRAIGAVSWDGTKWTWFGSSWASSGNCWSSSWGSGPTAGTRLIDFEWEPSGSKGIAVGHSTTANKIMYWTFGYVSSDSWSSSYTFPASSLQFLNGDYRWFQLERNPTGGNIKVYGMLLDTSYDIESIWWDGSLHWDGNASITDNASTYNYEVFDLEFQQICGYEFNWEHRITNIFAGYDNFNVRVCGHADNDENVGVYIWNKSPTGHWEFMGNLTASGLEVDNTISGSEIANYLTGDNLSISYFSATDLTQTNIYIDYVVVEKTNPSSWAEIGCSQPPNLMRPKDGSQDLNANTLWSSNGGTSWTTGDNQPIYLLENSTGREGNPYASAEYYPIYGDNWAGENFIASYETVTGVGAYVKTIGVGAPAGDLCFAIRWSDNNDNVVTGILATSAVHDNYTWRSASIPSAVRLGGVSYRFILYSPDSNADNYWALCAPSTLSDNSVYTSATYDGTNAVATYSNSGGASGSWTDDNKRDAVYNLRVATYKPSGWLQSSWFDPAGVPVNWGTINFSSVKPTGNEDVRVYAQASDNENDNWSPTGGPYSSGSSMNLAGRYCRYRVYLGASPGDLTTPRFDDIIVSWFWGAQVSWAKLRVSTPVNEYVAYDGVSRDNADVLYSMGGSSWVECDNQPIFVLDADTDGDGSVDGYDGNPYTAAAGSLQIWGRNYAGERITMSRSFTGGNHHVIGFQAYVRKVGSPGDNLYYELWDLTNGTKLDSGTFATAGVVDSSWTWVNTSFSKSCLLVTGREYRLSLSSPGSSSSDCYEWMALSTGIEDPYKQSAYGGTDSVAAYHPGGYNWEYTTNRDVLFRFTAARGYPSSGWLESSVFDVGEVSWQAISWSAVTSDNATVGVEARTGVDSNPNSGNWNDWKQVANGGLVLPENRYVQYRIIENTTNDNETPVLQSVTISYPRETPPEAPENSMVRTWVQTTTADFLADRSPDVIGQNVEVVSPGDFTLKATSYWGNQFVSSSGFSMASRLDSENKLFAIRFVAEEDEKVWNVKLMALVCCDGQIRGPTDQLGRMENVYWDVLLVGDSNGVPNMSNVLGRATGAPYKQFPQTPRGSGSTATGDRTSSIEWYLPYPRLGKTNDDMKFSLPGQPTSYHPQLTGGQTYHLVVTVSKDNAGSINRDNWIAIVSHRRDNIQPDYWINGKTYNTNRAVLFGVNRSGSYIWENSTTAGSPVEGRDPMYVLGVERGGTGRVTDNEGDPYYQSDEEIYTNNYVGERILIDNDYGDFSGDGMKIGAIELFMRGVGESIGESYVGIRLGSENLSEITYSIPLDYSSSYSWTRFTLPTSFTIWEGETYNVYIKSPASTQSSYGAVGTMETPWETNTKAPYVAATYDGSSSLYIWSYNDNLWNDDNCREVPFRFVTGYSQSGSFTSGVFDAGQVVDWQYIEWDETKPPGTNIKLYVLAGGERYGPVYNRSSLENVPDSRHISYEVEMTTDDPATSPALHEVRIGYRGGFGSLRIELQNQGEGKTLAYEGGAVIVKQNDRSTMYSMPDDMIVITENGNRLKLDVNYRLLMNPLSVKSTALTTMAGVNFYMPEDMRVVKENDNMSSVEITIVSDFAQAWYEYLQSVSDRINRSYPGWSYVTQPSEYEIKLVINENENRSIDYRETVREIEAQIL